MGHGGCPCSLSLKVAVSIILQNLTSYIKSHSLYSCPKTCNNTVVFVPGCTKTVKHFNVGGLVACLQPPPEAEEGTVAFSFFSCLRLYSSAPEFAVCLWMACITSIQNSLHDDFKLILSHQVIVYTF